MNHTPTDVPVFDGAQGRAKYLSRPVQAHRVPAREARWRNAEANLPLHHLAKFRGPHLRTITRDLVATYAPIDTHGQSIAAIVMRAGAECGDVMRSASDATRPNSPGGEAFTIEECDTVLRECDEAQLELDRVRAAVIARKAELESAGAL